MSASGFANPGPSEEIFRRLLDAAPDALVVTKPDGRIVVVNAQTERLFGYRREELLGKKVEVLLPHRLRRRHVKNRGAYLRHPTVRHMGSTMDLYGRRKDGTEFPVDISVSPLETNGEMLVSSCVRDITSRKQADDLSLQLAAIVNASDDAIIGKSLDGTIVCWNPGAERLYGYTAEEMIGKPLSQLVPPGRKDEFARILKGLRQGKRIERFETTRIHKDGHPIEISVTISPVRNAAGTVIGAAVVAQDVTERKRALEALRQSEERFRVALKNAPVTVFNHDRELRYTWINSPVLSWAKQQPLGHTDMDILGGEEGARLTAIKQEVLRSGQGTRTETQVTFEGETHYFDLIVEPLRDSRGAMLGLTCSATDISPTKRSLLEREGLITKLQEALEEVKLLAGLLSICASCKRIMNERKVWEPLESYIQSHSEAKFTHGMCPDCLRKLYPEYYPE